LSRSLNNLDIIFASDGENLAAHQQYRASTFLSPFPYVLSRELGVAFGVSALPYAIYLDAEGKVMAKGLVNNLEQLEGLLHPVQKQGEESKENLKLSLSKKDFSRSQDFKNTNQPA
jgi:methylamine dehydrogenase accessory protein MauD